MPGKLGRYLMLHRTEGLFAIRAKYLVDRTMALLNERIGIDPFVVQRIGKQPTHRTLAGRHETRQDNAFSSHQHRW